MKKRKHINIDFKFMVRSTPRGGGGGIQKKMIPETVEKIFLTVLFISFLNFKFKIR